MENTDPQNPSVKQFVEKSVKQPIPKKQSKTFLIILSILTILSLALAGYLGYQNIQLRKRVQKYSNEQVGSTPRSSTPGPTANWETFKSEDYDFSFKYPPDWSINYLAGGTMLAPNPTVEKVNKMIEENTFKGGKDLVITFKFPTGASGAEDNEYWTHAEESIQIAGRTADKYTGTCVQDVPSGTYFKGEKETMIVIPLKGDHNVFNISLTDQTYEKTFEQILSTFEFTQ